MRRALGLVALAVTAMVALAFLIPLAFTVREITRDRALGAAEREAASMGPLLSLSAEPAGVERAMAATDAGADGRMAVHLPGGTVLGTGRAREEEVARAFRRGRFASIGVPGGRVVLQPVALPEGGVAVVEVFLPGGELDRGVRKAWLAMAAVGAVLVAGSVVAADRMGTRVVRATQRLADAAGALGDGDLSVRIEPEGPPELVEAGLAFNAMADRVTQLLAAEREMAADLSHRLRTPLAALRLNAEALDTGPVGDQTREAVDRLEREVDQIIRAARRPAGRGSCDAARVLRDRVAFWSALAEDEGRSCELIGAGREAPAPLPAGELEAAVDALLGNVFRHTAEGTGFAVTLHVGEGVTGILVADAGPGIADPDTALERGRSGRGSTGLGLDIARRAAESTGGHLRIHRSALGGAQVQMWLRTGERAPARRARRSRRRARPRQRA
ncbi:sensor histidine kinase [Thermomonospora umbrina]|uniref:Signal transduction histidine-protein kinase/phosphatase MprB n=1 Tax=Thermomonospora umbrina TaxID=111806 RepID=A0A3D9T5X9_9ACTN|nr:HAMP domain-containing sensor histidine kinase [Thermomonospora umbrina]REE99171.1 signal transduction histidine kinase [Thermomonospora umbrina]